MDRRFANGVHKTVEGDMQYHSKPDVSDGLPDIIVIYSQYYGTRGYCNDALGRDGVHRRTYLFWKARRGAKKSRIKLGRTYRRSSVAHAMGCGPSSQCCEIGKFLERKSHVRVVLTQPTMVGRLWNCRLEISAWFGRPYHLQNNYMSHDLFSRQLLHVQHDARRKLRSF